MQNILIKKIAIAILFCAAGCSSGKDRKPSDSSLVRVAIVKLVNVSKAPTYEYLSDSLTEATRTSMQRKFLYFDLPANETKNLFEALDKKNGILDAGDLRAHALNVDADLVIYGRYTTTPGKKGDSAEIAFNVFRADKSIEICQGSRKAVISGAIFKDIDLIAAEVVAQIAAYRKSQLESRGEKENKDPAVEKVELTRESINIQPFIPPVF